MVKVCLLISASLSQYVLQVHGSTQLRTYVENAARYWEVMREQPGAYWLSHLAKTGAPRPLIVASSVRP